MEKLLKIWVVGILLLSAIGCSKEDPETKDLVINIEMPTSSASNPIITGSSVTIKGTGFTKASEIWFRPLTKSTEVKAVITSVTATEIVFTAPELKGAQTVVLKQDGKEQLLGEILFASIITNLEVPPSTAADPILLGSSVKIKGEGFTETSEIWFRLATRETDIKAVVTSVTATEIVFTAPDVDRAETVVLKQDGKEQVLGEFVFSDYLSTWGLLAPIGDRKSNNRDYEWYIDQRETGGWASVNCGPASTTMMLKWNDPSFSKTTEDARAAYVPGGGWWFTNHIEAYLNDNGTTNTVYGFESVENLKYVIDQNGIAILCLDMYYITGTSNPTHRIHKFYPTENAEWGHFIVIKGYIYSDNKLYFEAYDPWSIRNKYPDGQLKGKDRYYLGSDLYSSAQIWWKYMITVMPPQMAQTGVSPLKKAENPPIQWGR